MASELTAGELDAILDDCDESEWPSFRRSTIRSLVAMARRGMEPKLIPAIDIDPGFENEEMFK